MNYTVGTQPGETGELQRVKCMQQLHVYSYIYVNISDTLPEIKPHLNMSDMIITWCDTSKKDGFSSWTLKTDVWYLRRSQVFVNDN